MHRESEITIDPLAAALQALPPPLPAAGGWQRLQSSLQRRQAGRRRVWILASAAALAGVALLATAPQPPSGVDPLPTGIAESSASDEAALAALIDRSTRLEAELGWLEADAPSAAALAADLDLVERLQWVDLLLSDPQTGAATREVLWRERVELLQRRVALGRHELLLIAHGERPAATVAM